MQINLIDTFSSTAKAVFFPLIEGEAFPPALLTLAEKAGLDDGILQQAFIGTKKEVFWFHHGSQRIYLLGLGKSPDFATYLQVARSAVYQQRKKLPATLSLEVAHFPADSFARFAEAAINGVLLGRYKIGVYKSEKEENHPFFEPDAGLEVGIHEEQRAAATTAVQRAQTFATTQLEIFDLVNAPANKKNPADLAAWAVAAKRPQNLRVTVFSLEEIKAMGLNCLLAVNQGSEYPACFIVLEYNPPNAGSSTPKVGLVGKGVTFDTGGLSIKPSMNLHFMKSDMGGAAAVFGAMEVAAKLELNLHLVAAVPVTDNSVDAKSLKPSDVISSYSGKSVEIIDTDAEGRLILADGLSYIEKHFKPDILIDLATLTGSVIRSLGYFAGGLFCNSEELTAQLLAASNRSGERLWPFPIWDDYKDYIKSDVADVKNFSGKPLAGAITAAKFLEYFINDHPKWAHLDIAGVALCDSEFARQKSATGFGIRLLIEFFESLEQ